MTRPATSTSMIPFAVLPWVRVPGVHDLGKFSIWQNTNENWFNLTGGPTPSILQTYATSSGAYVGPGASIVTPKPINAEVHPADFFDPVAALSTAAWVSGDGRASDCWFFEVWPASADRTAAWVNRQGKSGQVDIADVETHQIRPPPYAQPLRLEHGASLSSIDQRCAWARAMLTGADVTSRRELVAARHLHRARFDAPHLSTVGDDVESVWSAFEALYETRGNPRFDDKRFSDFPDETARMLRSAFPPDKREKHQLVCQLFLEELEQFHSLSSQAKQTVAETIANIYEIRNRHSHGDVVNKNLFLVAGGFHCVTLGPKLLQVALRTRMSQRLPGHGGDQQLNFLAAEAVADIDDLVLHRGAFEEALSILDRTKRTDWWPPTADVRYVERCIAAAHAFRAFCNCHRITVRDTHAVQQARKQLLLVISFWTSYLLEENVIDAADQIVGWLPREFERLSRAGESEADIHSILAMRLVRKRAFLEDTYASAVRESAAFALGPLEFPLVVETYLAFNESIFKARIR